MGLESSSFASSNAVDWRGPHIQVLDLLKSSQSSCVISARLGVNFLSWLAIPKISWGWVLRSVDSFSWLPLCFLFFRLRSLLRRWHDLEMQVCPYWTRTPTGWELLQLSQYVRGLLQVISCTLLVSFQTLGCHPPDIRHPGGQAGAHSSVAESAWVHSIEIAKWEFIKAGPSHWHSEGR